MHARLNVSMVTEARGNATAMTYGARGNLLTRTAPAPLSYEEVFTCDSMNNLLTTKDRRIASLQKGTLTPTATTRPETRRA